jgi:hypothetical protein
MFQVIAVVVLRVVGTPPPSATGGLPTRRATVGLRGDL